MSIVSSVLSSSRTSGWKIKLRLSSLMDSVFAIAFGLGLRFVVDAVGHQDFKLTGTLIGLWEGVILLHFLKKRPKSSDPYIAYAVRLFIDFFFTESVARLVLVLIWTALGMVLADVIPAIWDDVGLRRVWKRFRRDLYTMVQMIPTVAFFPPAQTTVRFSPSRAPSVVSALGTGSVFDATERSITIDPIPSTSTPLSPPVQRQSLRRRHLPGYFPYTDTESDAGSVRSVGTFGGVTGRRGERTSRRQSVFPQRLDEHDLEFDLRSELSGSQNDIDDGNLSDTSSNLTERNRSGAIPDPETIPDMEVEIEPPNLNIVTSKPDENELTPRNRHIPLQLPPTPSDSAARWGRNGRDSEDGYPSRHRPLSATIPESAAIPLIPDSLDDTSTEDWEKIKKEELNSVANEEEKPPTPPAKDDLPPGFSKNTASDSTDKSNANNTSITPNTNDNQGSSTVNVNRQSQPPPYDYPDDYDDMYVSDPPAEKSNPIDAPVGDLLGGYDDAGVPPVTDNVNDPTNLDDNDRPLSDIGLFQPGNPWANGFGEQAAAILAEKQKEEEERRAREQDEEIEQLRIAEEAKAAAAEAERKRKEEAEKMRLEEEEQARKAAEEKERKEKEKKDGEKAERKKKEEEDEAARQREREELRKREEETAKKREEEAAKKEEEAKKKREEEEEAVRVEKARKKEERKRKKEEDAAKKKAEEDAAAEKAEQDAAAEKAAKEAAAKKAEEEAAAKKAEEEAAAKKVEEEAAAKKAEEEVAAKKVEEEAAAKKAEEEAATKRGEEETASKKEEERIQREEEARLREEADLQKLKEEMDAEASKTTGVTGDNSGKPVDDGHGMPTPNDKQDTRDDLDALGETHLEEQEQEHGNLDDPSQRQHPLGDEGSFPDDVTNYTEASEMPSQVRDRLERLLLTRAQIAELEGQIEGLNTNLGTSEDEGEKARIQASVKAMEKTIRKLRKKEERRAAEAPPPKHIGPKFKLDTDEVASLESLTPRDAESKIEEKLEGLLMQPDVRSLAFQIKVPSGNQGKKIMPNVTSMLEKYCLYTYTMNDKSGARHMHINVPEDAFRTWLTTYRQAVTRPTEESNEEDYWQSR